MDVKTGLFYLFSAVMLFAAFRVITARNPVHAALYLVLAFFQASAVWLLLKAEFLAITLVLVYVGAVMVPDAEVLTIEFKINLLAPAQGERFRMEGRVLKPGRTITVCEGRAYALHGGGEKLIATMGCTLMAITARADVSPRS